MGLQIEVKYRGYLKHSDATGLYVSWCPLLDIKSQGTTPEQARASLDDAVRLFVTHCFRRGILEEALKRRGLEAEDFPDDAPFDQEECVSVKTMKSVPETLDAWYGSVPLNLVATSTHALA